MKYLVEMFIKDSSNISFLFEIFEKKKKRQVKNNNLRSTRPIFPRDENSRDKNSRDTYIQETFHLNSIYFTCFSSLTVNCAVLSPNCSIFNSIFNFLHVFINVLQLLQ